MLISSPMSRCVTSSQAAAASRRNGRGKRAPLPNPLSHCRSRGEGIGAVTMRRRTVLRPRRGRPSRRLLRATDFAIGSAGVVASAPSPAPARAAPRDRRRTPRPSPAARPDRRRSTRAGAAPSRAYRPREYQASVLRSSCLRIFSGLCSTTSAACRRQTARRSASDGGPGSGCALLQRRQRAEQPRVAHRAAADHHRVAAGLALHPLVGGDVLDVAVADDRDLARQRGAHGGDRLHARGARRSPARACGRAR